VGPTFHHPPPAEISAGDRVCAVTPPSLFNPVITCPIHRVRAPKNSPRLPLHFPPPSSLDYAARPVKSLAGAHRYLRPFLLDSGDSRRFRHLFLVLSDSTTPCAPPCKFLLPRTLLFRRFQPYPKPHRRAANSSLLSLPPQEGTDDSMLRNLFPTPRRAPWAPSPTRTTTGVQPPLTTEPSATAPVFFDDLTVNAGEPLSQICFHPLDLDPSVQNRSLNRRVMG
jgi:hypothetical protein